MEKAGIDTDKYKAHSIRGASTSKANKGGLSAAQIMQRANWSKARTFYVKKKPDEFQNKVLA